LKTACINEWLQSGVSSTEDCTTGFWKAIFNRARIEVGRERLLALVILDTLKSVLVVSLTGCIDVESSKEGTLRSTLGPSLQYVALACEVAVWTVGIVGTALEGVRNSVTGRVPAEVAQPTLFGR
jgi:hypothetical protein